MADKRIIDYINNGLRQGHSAASLRQSLIGQGWSPGDVEQAFRMVQAAQDAQNAQNAQSMHQPPQPPLPAQAGQAAQPGQVAPQSQPAQAARAGQIGQTEEGKEAAAERAGRINIASKFFMALVSPGRLFNGVKEEALSDAFVYMVFIYTTPAAIFLILALLSPETLIMILSPSMGFMIGSSMLPEVLIITSLILILSLYLGGILGMFVASGIFHFILTAAYENKRPFSETYKAAVYAITPFIIMNWIISPVSAVSQIGFMAVSILVGIWALATVIKGLGILQEMTKMQSAVVALLPATAAFIVLYIIPYFPFAAFAF